MTRNFAPGDRRVAAEKYVEDRKFIGKKWQCGTCAWIHHCLEFRSWRTVDDENFLWIFAGPGAGKTILAWYIIECLITFHKSVEPGTVLYFYCIHDNVSQSSACEVMKSLAFQVLKLYSPLVVDGSSIARDYGDIIDCLSEIDIYDLINLDDNAYGKFFRLFEALRLRGSIEVVIDGLDEYPDSEMEILLDFLGRFSDHHGAIINVLVLGRPEKFYQNRRSTDTEVGGFWLPSSN